MPRRSDFLSGRGCWKIILMGLLRFRKSRQGTLETRVPASLFKNICSATHLRKTVASSHQTGLWAAPGNMDNVSFPDKSRASFASSPSWWFQ